MSGMGVMLLCSWMLVSSHECCWRHGAMFLSAHGCLWVVMNAYKHSWVWPHVAMSTNEGPWPLLITHEALKATISTHDHGIMAQTALISADKHSWAWCHSNHTTHSTLVPNLTVLISVHGGSRVLMGGLKYSGALLNPQKWSWVYDFLIH